MNLKNKNREKTKKSSTFNLSFFTGKSYFDNHESQNLIIQPVFKYFQIFSGTTNKFLDGNLKGCLKKRIIRQKTKGLL